MKFELLGDWPKGQFLIPKGTIISDTDPDWIGAPLNALPLDQAAADYLSTTYPAFLHLLRAGPGCSIRKLINA